MSKQGFLLKCFEFFEELFQHLAGDGRHIVARGAFAKDADRFLEYIRADVWFIGGMRQVG